MSRKLKISEIKKILANTRATLEMEELNSSKESDEIVTKFLSDEITEKQAKKLTLKKYGIL